MASKVFPVICGVLAASSFSTAWADYSYIQVNSSSDEALDSTANGLCTLREAVGMFNKTNKTTNTDCTKVVVISSGWHPNEIRIPYTLMAPSIPTLSLSASLGAIDVSPDEPLHIRGSTYIDTNGNLQQSQATIVRPALESDAVTYTNLTDAIFNISSVGASVPIEISHFSLWRGRGVDGGAIKTTQTLTLNSVEIRDTIASGSGAAIY
ncbi:MAG TPA: hypothetical protein VFM46_17175, partial [Pseudomonadales bacterium]|nr:hypothetical protein [Pseudomonadales bacterium]